MASQISIVMTVLNRAGEVGEAIGSVLSQGVDSEIVVVDGGSTDGTRELLKAHPRVRLIDAPGSSLYQGLNIGIACANGDLIGLLHSDDRLPPRALAMVLECAGAHPGADVFRGRAAFSALDQSGARRPIRSMERAVSRALDIRNVTFGVPAINACFVSAAAYRSLGLFDDSLKIAADREWLLRALLRGVKVALIDGFVYEYRVHEGSLTIGPSRRSEAQYAREHLAIVARYLPFVASAEWRRILRLWHAREMMRFLVRSRDVRALAQGVRSAFRLSPAWPVLAVGALLDYARGRLAPAPD
jgi:glycosyltransferase involved in cell wall biosynthesis